MNLLKKTAQVIRHAPGTAPGTLKAIENAPPPQLQVMAFSPDELTEADIEKPEEISPYIKKWPVTWINVDGLGDTEAIEACGEKLGLHILALEDVFNTSHRPKAEEFEDHIFVIMRMARIRDGVLDIEQISLFFGRKYVMTFQERPEDVLDPVRQRIRKGSGRRIRLSRSDYLAYAIIDAVIDGYFPVLEHYIAQLDELEDLVIDKPDETVMTRTHEIKRALQLLRQSMWPMREALNTLSAEENKLVHDDTRPFLRDALDHVIQVMDIIETSRERAAGITDLYLSSLSNKMNEVMKVLTIIATIFIPLGFIAGLYGMNFNPEASPWNMPELSWPFGYPLALGIMLLIAGGMLLYFANKGWIGTGKKR